MHHTKFTDHHATVYPDNRRPYNLVSNYVTAYLNLQAGKSYTEWRHKNCVSLRFDNLIPTPLSSEIQGIIR